MKHTAIHYEENSPSNILNNVLNNQFTLEPEDTTQLANLCGPLDSHLRELERHFRVRINNRGYLFSINGEQCEMASHFLQSLYQQSGERLTLEDIHLTLQKSSSDESFKKASDPSDSDEEQVLTIQTPQRLIKARGFNQKSYVRNIDHFDLTFGIGPAGTGKTYLAVAKGVEFLEKGRVDKLVLVRPAVEAGEQLGFLPGDLSQKIDPYLRPMYDALHAMVKLEKVERLTEQGIIEIAPLAYMRGRSLDKSFIILDEAQNTTKEQMKMLLTRIGLGSKAVVTGDLTQIDLPSKQVSGLRHALEALKGIEKIAFSFLEADDVIRHPLLREIINAYEKHHRESS